LEGKGIAISLVSDEEKLKDIQDFYKTRVEEIPGNIKELLA
jgi:hypothetical protein